jgi:RNA polymerase sigma-70 factor, ECF subfamily
MNRMSQSVGSPEPREAAAARESDAIAVERVLAGDRDAYRILVERYSRYVYRLAFRLSGNTHDAEEIVQEAFFRAYQKLEKFEARSNFGTWVYRIAANYTIDRMRQRTKEEARRETPELNEEEGVLQDPLAIVPDAKPSPERLMQSVQLRRKMQQALGELTQAERIAFVMRHWDGCGIEEIASVLKTNTSATKNTVFRAVQKLRRALEPFVEPRTHVRAIGTEG